MKKRLIVNADDFGFCQCVNRGIVQACRDGILTSTTLLANGLAFEEAVTLAHETPGLGVGVHLNVVRGVPVATAHEVAPLLDGDGRFAFGFYEIGSRVRDAAVLAAVETEYRAQIQRVIDAGIKPTHLDSEKHHAVWGRLHRLQQKLAQEFGIPAVRNLSEPVVFALRTLPWPGFRRALDAVLLRSYATLAHRSGGPAQPDRLLGQSHIGGVFAPVWRRLLERLPPGISEVMVHPGTEDGAGYAATEPVFGQSWINATRSRELAALLAPEVRDKVDANGIELVSFGVFDRQTS